MRPINLIPPEDRRESAPLRRGPLAYVLVGVLLLGFVGVYALVSTGNTISEREAQVASLEQELATSQARAEALQSFSGFASLEEARTSTVSNLARSRFDWERVMRELALVLPSDVTLIDLSGSIGGTGTEDAESDSGGAAVEIAGPSLTMTGCGADHESVAKLVAALRDIDGVTRVGLTRTQAGGSEGGDADAASQSTSGDAVGGCVDPKLANFELTVAFDGVQVDPSGTGIVPQEPVPGSGNAPVAGDDPANSAAPVGPDVDAQPAENVVPGT
jgi:Tfp pilus assembly protein PilN